MQDMLVRLVDLPDIKELERALINEGFIFRRPIAPEKRLLVEWTELNFSDYWASEVDVAFASGPVNCILAQYQESPVGFACYNVTAKNFFGPTGVLDEYRGRGIGKVLLIKALKALQELGYAYAIIGGVGPVEYYQKTVNAKIIEGSEQSIYNHLLKRNESN